MPSSARSLAEDLRARSDDELERLLELRPDLLTPVPKSMADLALRVNSGASVVAALDELTTAHLQVLEAACALAPAGRFGTVDVAGGLDADPGVVERIVADLLTRALLWGAGPDLRAPSAVREALGPTAAGLDPVVRENLPGIRLALGDPAAFTDRLSLAPPEARALLLHHAWGPPQLPPGGASAWLARQDFMAVDESGTVVLPREIALLLRRGALSPEPLTIPEPAPPAPDERAAADRHAGHAADQFVRDTDRALGLLRRQVVRRQANGAPAQRDWERFVTATGLADTRAALVLAVAWEVGWLDADAEAALRPTRSYERHADAGAASRWAQLVSAWWTMARLGHRPADALPRRPDPQVPAARRLALTALADGAGTDVLGWLAWHRPRCRVPGSLIAAAAADADALGLSFAGVPTAGTGGLLRGDEGAQLAADIRDHLPTPTDRIVLQADLTATALGPLETSVERRLAEVAEWESGGAAAVFRFTPDSVRAALARGVPGDETLAWLGRVSATPVPQALQVLLADQQAALPTTAVHDVMAVVTCEPDEAQRMLADPALAELGLRLLTPGVMAARVPSAEVAAVLAQSGRAVARPDQESLALDPDRVTATPAAPPVPARVVRSLRRVEAGSGARHAPPQNLSPAGPAQIQSGLASAAADHRQVWVSFADDGGGRLTHLLEPLHLAAGDVCAFDHTAGEIRTIPLERIVAAAPAGTDLV